MKTNDLIAMLARGDVAVLPLRVERRFAIGMGLGLGVTVLLMAITLGTRDDLGAALHMPMFWVKLTFAASLAFASLQGAVRLSRPGAPLGHTPAAVLTPIAALWLLAIVTLYCAAPQQRTYLIMGDTWAVCPVLIAMLAVPVFGGALWAFRGLAPTRLRLAGATAGLSAGAFATLVYSLHCPEMAAPFIATWYVLGIAIPAAVGALLGPPLLRW
jgi:hypothetical protein